MSQHKEAAKSFLKMAGGGKVQEAYDQYVGPSFIHHNQYFKGDLRSLLTAMQDASKSHPNKSIEVHHIYEDGDTVITHSLVSPQDAKAAEYCRGPHLSIRARSHRRTLGFGPADLEGFA